MKGYTFFEILWIWNFQKISNNFLGIDAIQNSWPWIVQLKYNNFFQCSGTLLDESTVVTGTLVENYYQYTFSKQKEQIYVL